MEVLSSEIIYKMNPICEIIASIGSAIMFLFGLFFLLTFLVMEYDWSLIVSLILIFSGFITVLTFLIIGEYCWRVEDYTKQEVIFKEAIPIEFFNDYEILEQRGEIFVIKEKEN
jgi:nicotinamide riboside transporter PnuC